MDDKKQIEEMAVICCGSNDTCTDCFKQSERLLGIKINNRAKHCQAYCYAEMIYNAGYRKLPENAVVLTREEYEKQKAKCADCFNEWEKVVKENEKLQYYNDKLSQGIYYGNGEQFCNRLKLAEQEARKETAREICEKIKSRFNASEYRTNTKRKTIKVEELCEQMDWVLHKVGINIIDEIAKEYGVEVE